MNRPTAIRRANVDRERGSITVMTAVLAAALMLLVGLVVDGAARARALSRADAVAAEAARAAATAVDTRGPTVTVDTTAAVRAAQAYLASAGVTGTVELVGTRTVDVTVTITGSHPVPLPGASGFEVRGHAQVELAVGVTEPGS